jgi:hypothetical protein
MEFVLHTSGSRGYANHGWLEARHSFSFANWYDSKKVHFGALRVLNDDIIAPGKGFGEHPHNNMEIITIPLHGALEHRDSMGNHGIIRAGEVQVMSAGSGVFHSEFNASTSEEISLFQIWIFPNKTDVSPRYDQIGYELDLSKSQLIPLVCPKNKTVTKGQTWIHQEAWISLGNIIKTDTLDIDIKTKGNGFYIIVIEGVMNINNQRINKRDAIGIWNTDQIKTSTNSSCSFLLIDVPMLTF